MTRSPDQATKRRTARLVAVQALHASLHDLELKSRNTHKHTAQDLASPLRKNLTEPDLGEFAHHWFEQKDPEEHATYAQPDRDLFERLIRGALRSAHELAIELDKRLAPKWKLERLEITLQALLLVGAWEIRAARAAKNTDLLHIALKDYVELADSFFTGGEASLVNAVLDRVWTDAQVQDDVSTVSETPLQDETSTHKRRAPLADRARVKLTTSHLYEIDERRLKTLRANARSQRDEQQDLPKQKDVEPEGLSQNTSLPERPAPELLAPEPLAPEQETSKDDTTIST